MRLCDLDEIKICVDRQYENCHGYSGSKKAIYREAILAVKSILHSAKSIDGVTVQEWMMEWLQQPNENQCLYGEKRIIEPQPDGIQFRTVDDLGRICIPKDIRDKLGLKPGTECAVCATDELTSDEIIVIRRNKNDKTP